MEQPKHWLLASSQNPTQFGNTVRGFVMLLAVPSVIGLISAVLGFTVLPSDIEQLADQLAILATQLSIIIGAVWTAYGAVMKAVSWVNEKLLTRARH